MKNFIKHYLRETLIGAGLGILMFTGILLVLAALKFVALWVI